MTPSTVDIVHTELCSLHLQPLRHTMDQLIVESLFSDGFIKYTAAKTAPANSFSFKVFAVYDQIIPNSEKFMTWGCESHGMGMTLSKEVPVVVLRSLQGYLERLCALCGFDKQEIISNALFAVHPGGPKILKYVQEALDLKKEQILHSETILRNYGNMSSATLPHIWEEVLKDPNVPEGTKVVSLAFGPGLTFCGGLFEKVRGEGCILFPLLPFLVQMIVIGIDEFYFHIRRGLPKWERWGHPLDTLTVLGCFLFVLWVPFTAFTLKIYIGIALFSCLSCHER